MDAETVREKQNEASSSVGGTGEASDPDRSNQHRPLLPDLWQEMRRFADQNRINALGMKDLATDLLLHSMRHGLYETLGKRWFAHRLLERRGVPPCLRKKLGFDGEIDDLTRYEIWCADVSWVRKMHPNFEPSYLRPTILFKATIVAEKWHARAAHWANYYEVERRTPCRFTNAVFGFDRLPSRRQRELSYLLTKPVQKERLPLRKLDQVTQELTMWAHEHPDKSASVKPDSVALRRAQAWRLKTVSQSDTIAARYFELEAGKSVSRQLIQKFAAHAEDICADLKHRKTLKKRAQK